MNVLVLGGTKFVGRHIVEALAAANHSVTILTRGISTTELPESVERLTGDRDTGMPGLESLKKRQWDACIDVSGYTPKQVRASCEFLKDSISRYLFISSVSVYVDPCERPVKETNPLLSPAAEDITEINGETYGPLKVTCENIVRETFSNRAIIFRPQIVAGPYDHTLRYTYWIKRALQGGEMLAPGDGYDHLQVIDARDLARFAVTTLENNLAGEFNLAGPRITWEKFISFLTHQKVVWVNEKILESAELSFMELPLYRPEDGERASLMDVSSEKSEAHGLILTDPEVTAMDTRKWSQSLPTHGLPADRECALLALAKAG